MNKHSGRQLHKPMGRREMIVTAAKGFAGAALLLEGCAGTEKHSRPLKKEEIKHGTLVLPRKELKHYGINDLDTQEEGCLVKYLEDAGKPAVITFWQWHCEPCIIEMEDFEALHRRNPGIQVIGIHTMDMEEDIGKQLELARNIVADVGVTFPQFTTRGGNAYDIAVRVLGQESCPMPVNLIVDSWQRIVYKAEYIGYENIYGMSTDESPAHHEFMRVLGEVAGEDLGPGPNRHKEKEEPAQEAQVEGEPEPAAAEPDANMTELNLKPDPFQENEGNSRDGMPEPYYGEDPY